MGLLHKLDFLGFIVPSGEYCWMAFIYCFSFFIYYLQQEISLISF